MRAQHMVPASVALDNRLDLKHARHRFGSPTLEWKYNRS